MPSTKGVKANSTLTVQVFLENSENEWKFAQGGFVQQKDFYIRVEKKIDLR